MRIKETTLVDKTIALSNKEVNILGPDVVLRNCVIKSRAAAKNISLLNVVLIGCKFVAQSIIRNLNFCSATFQDCEFSGRFVGCSFGCWPEYFTIPVIGSMEGGDFSGAELDSCRFVDCEPSGIVFPRWPCFTIVDPCLHADEIMGIDWPDDVRFLMEAFATSPSKTTAVSGYAPSIIKKYGGTETDIKKKLSSLKGVIL